ncbi:DUF397 domain-containing protein [Nonomuraea turkmeniaca]|uniref:DUF397 domain-containing protein n=1 Tax=Nonomuraea turkmeniaca TaxID=103838 RepID=A0A5S4EW36_9ACTN|nr:DUF397 domain-containing protein [Nonomuraea turkmeniaca]TMR07832.1 DUF397 domain-containing protein [Nonomuraea turkmeniaca]
MTISQNTPDKFINWHKSTYSGGDSNCVEVAFAADGTVGVRDTKDRTGPHLEFTSAEWRAFVAGVNNGEFLVP